MRRRLWLAPCWSLLALLAWRNPLLPLRIFDDQDMVRVANSTIHPTLQPSRPLQVLELYMAQHGVDALQQDILSNNTRHRQYALAYYSCPAQAGNRLHHFLNSVLWSIVTNRTVLWKYYDQATCDIVGRDYDPAICVSANTEHDCANVLQRASWVPSYDEFRAKLDLPLIEKRRQQEQGSVDDAIVALNFWSTHRYYGQESTKFPWIDNLTGVDIYPARIVDFPVMLGKDGKELARNNSLLATKEARQRVQDLFALGADYLYGMLFDNLFAFQPSVQPPNYSTNNSFTIGLHSRHANRNDNGANITRELRALDTVLERRNPQQRAQDCLLFAMSDRPSTLQRLQPAATQRNCTLITIANKTVHFDFRLEHGLWTGIGFYQDWALLAAHVVHAMVVSPSRSSSDLIGESIAYRRVQEHVSTTPLIRVIL